MATKFKLGQKVTIREGFYAPVNAFIVKVETGLGKSDLSTSFGIEDYLKRCTEWTRYDVAYLQRGFMDRISKKEYMSADDIEAGWHGMKANNDKKEFEKFGVKERGIE